MNLSYQPQWSLLLEALSYLGSRAGGHSPSDLQQKLAARGLDSRPVQARFEPYQAALAALEQDLPFSREELQPFDSLPGLPYSTIGINSPAFFLIYPMLDSFDGDTAAFLQQIRALRPDEIARNLLISMEIENNDDHPAASFLQQILALDIPAESRIAVLETFNRYPAVVDTIARFLIPTVEAVQRHSALLDSIAAQVESLAIENPAAYLRRISSFEPEPNRIYRLRPLLLGCDTVFSSCPEADGSITIYCGSLRLFIRDLLAQTEDMQVGVFNALRVLGDQTRFDILCYLQKQTAYGQELSEHFGLARNTIHHHMAKLQDAGLVTCTADGTRTYYDVNRDRIRVLLELQRRLLLGE